MKHGTLAIVAVILVAETGGDLLGQEQVERHDLTGRSVEARELIEILKPKSEIGRRGGGARSLGAEEPDCRRLHERQTRGLGFEPVADVAAIDILFAFDSDEISPDAETNLKALGEALSSRDLKSYCIALEGHTDSIGTELYNQDLSDRRARSVARYLAEHFDVRPERLLTQGFGETQHVATNDTEEGRRKNRRVEIKNLGHGKP